MQLCFDHRPKLASNPIANASKQMCHVQCGTDQSKTDLDLESIDTGAAAALACVVRKSTTPALALALIMSHARRSSLQLSLASLSRFDRGV